MRQVVSMVKDGRVQYALVDDETGEMTEFAQILVPDDFGLHESAHLGTNLISAIGLNGKSSKTGPGRRAIPPADQPALLFDTPHELPAPSQTDSKPKPKAKALSKHTYPSGRAKPDPANKVGRKITGDEVLAIVDRYPDGLTSRDIAARIWRQDTGRDEKAPHWMVRSVENRLNYHEERRTKYGDPLPYRPRYVPRKSADGRLLTQKSKLYCALPQEEEGG
jgi:hypothetical protein